MSTNYREVYKQSSKNLNKIVEGMDSLLRLMDGDCKEKFAALSIVTVNVYHHMIAHHGFPTNNPCKLIIGDTSVTLQPISTDPLAQKIIEEEFPAKIPDGETVQ